MNFNKISKNYGLLASIIFTGIILLLVLQGRPGNPTETELNTTDWKQNGPFELSPERGRYALAYSIFEDRSLFLSLPLARFVVPDLGYSNNRFVSLFAPTVSFIVLPGMIIGSLLGNAQLGTFAVISLFALMNIILIRKIAIKLGADTLPATLASLIFLFATPAFTYSVTLYQHHISTFLLLIVLYLHIASEHKRYEFLMWILYGIAITVDYPNFFVFLPIMLSELKKIISRDYLKTSVSLTIHSKKALSVAAIVIPLALFMLYNNQTFGSPFQLSGTVMTIKSIDKDGIPSQEADFNDDSDSTIHINPTEEAQSFSALTFFNTRNMVNGLYTLFFSTDRGTVFYTPIILFSIGGIILIFRKRNVFLPVILSTLAMIILLYSMWGDPWGGWAFGSRYLIPAYAIAAIFIAFIIPKVTTKAVLLLSFIVLFAYSSYINTAGVLTSKSNPPRVEILSLEKQTGTIQKQTYERNFARIKNNESKSYIYQMLMEGKISVNMYFLLIWSSIFISVTVPVLTLYRERKELYNAARI